MDTSALIGVLAFGTLFAVLVFAYRSTVEMEKRRQQDKRRSTLAANAPDTTPPGVKPPDT
ncbi:hypothetical protein [Rhodobaculum claviforme]|uniref:Uncharacterized protein n=1 Tax=Rhodobaculum claviforme TaxID=1549854 RepID=A0A934TM04_9RHOB|nr:hypothetical protein [Rhodobaculum claviforme]MBK5927926.1 hypothetical protein [Rhodobaculum claviforme]